jgi:hypothetical protein
LLKYCSQYKPELVMTTDVLPGDQEGRLLEAIKKRSPETRILLLPDLLSQGSRGDILEEVWSKEILRAADGLPASEPPIYLNGF